MPEFESWDDFDLPTESFSDDDVKNANSSGKAPAGTYLCECIDSTPVRKNGAEYSFVQANLKWKILEAKKIGANEVEAGEYEDLEGKFIWDSINMYHPSEKPGTKNRRVLVASKLGLLDGGKELTRDSWSGDVLGRKALVTTIDNEWVDKFGGKQTNVKVDFGGYQSVDQGPVGEEVDPLKDL